VRSECPLWAKSGHDTHACVSSALPQIPDITSARCRIRDRERQEQFAPRPALRQSGNRQRKRHVRFGSLADICSAKGHVRFAPNSDRESGFPHKVMSALPPKADMCGAASDVRFGPIADIGLSACLRGLQTKAAARGRIIVISVNSPGCVTTSIEPLCCLTIIS